MANEFKLSPKLAIVLVAVIVLFILLFISTTQKQVTTAPPELPTTETAAVPEQAAEVPAPPEEQQPAALELIAKHPQLKVISLVNRPTDPKSGDLVTFTLTVKNVGDNAPATPVEFFVDGESLTTVQLAALDRNAGGVVKANWTAPGKGNYAVTANVTPVPGEIIISDNTATTTFTVFQ